MTGQIVETVLVAQEARRRTSASDLIIVRACGALDRRGRSSNAVIALRTGLTEMLRDVCRIGAVGAAKAEVAWLAWLALRRVNRGIRAGRTQNAAVSLQEGRVVSHGATSRAEDASL